MGELILTLTIFQLCPAAESPLGGWFVFAGSASGGKARSGRPIAFPAERYRPGELPGAYPAFAAVTMQGNDRDR